MKLTDVKVGDKLVADGGFTCLDEGQICTVFRDSTDGALAVHCRNGVHDLKGQVDTNPKSPSYQEIIGFKRVS